MIHETLIHQLTVKALCKRMDLGSREVDVLLLLYTSKSLSTPSIHQLLGIRKSEINRRLGPRLITLGWLASEQVTHSNKPGLPTNRWWIPKDKHADLDETFREIRREVISTLGLTYSEDLQWTALSPDGGDSGSP
jgi:predicted transcriptional regulator